MARVLVLGSAPLPFTNARRLYGPGIRTWQFGLPLLNQGHEVWIVAGQAPEAGMDEPQGQRYDGLRLTCLPQAEFEAADSVRRAIRGFFPDAVVAAGYGASNVAVRLGIDRPIWTDFFGDAMAEAQALARVAGDDEMVYRIWSYVAPVLDRGDIFSVVSERQKCALIGQLSTRGRLNRYTLEYDLVKTVPCGIAPLPGCQGEPMRGHLLPEGAFLALWSGGYNTWADVDTLFEALVLAMDRREDIHFVSTGGCIHGHDESTYPRFLDRVSSSRHKDRFHLFGWVDTEQVPSFYEACDVGINVDRSCYEGFLGSRNRILDWANAGLAVLTTESCELSQILKDRELGFVVPPKDPEAMARAMVLMAEDRMAWKARANQARLFVRDSYSFEATARPLVEWMRDPQFAPDRGGSPRLGNPWNVYAWSLRRKWTGLKRMAQGDGLFAAATAAVRGLARRLGIG